MNYEQSGFLSHLNPPAAAWGLGITQRKLILGIHIENADGRSANGGFGNQINASLFEMFYPAVAPWMKQLCHCIGVRINARQVWPFVQITIDAGQRQVIKGITSSMELRNDVLDAEGRQWRIALRQLTKLATISGAFPNAGFRLFIH